MPSDLTDWQKRVLWAVAAMPDRIGLPATPETSHAIAFLAKEGLIFLYSSARTGGPKAHLVSLARALLDSGACDGPG